jgi:uncharacterized repeat protein (TIGR03837 family)
VVDNYGDLAVCRRVALNLAALGQCVRLWVDDAALMHRMDPHMPRADESFWQTGSAAVAWVHWQAQHEAQCREQPGDVVIEAFGCNPPEAFVRHMRERLAQTAAAPPVWINLEYLSAEAYVERSHGLPSPQHAGQGAGLTKWFFYPGFTRRTGGLLMEGGLMDRRLQFDRRAWLRGIGVEHGGERLVSVFAYPRAPLENWMATLARTAQEDHTPVRLMVTQGPLQSRARKWLAAHPAAATKLRLTELPWLSSEDFDHLLWACDLNLVRGEDSLVRAIWAGQPFIWQIYEQEDGVHAQKLQAFWQTVMAPHEAPAAGLQTLAAWWQGWNGLTAWPESTPFPWADWPHWASAFTSVRQTLAQQTALAPALLEFAAKHRSPG